MARRCTIDEARLRALVAEGKTDGEVGAALGVDRTSVASARKRWGIAATRRPGEKRADRKGAASVCSWQHDMDAEANP